MSHTDQDHEYDIMLEAQELAADTAAERAAETRVETLVDVLGALKQERARMTRGNGYTLANVYGMNNAVDVVAKMIGEANGN